MPSWGFSLAVSGSTIPDLVFSSFSTGFTTTRSPSGFRFVYALLNYEMWLAVLAPECLALPGNECQFYYPPEKALKPPGYPPSPPDLPAGGEEPSFRTSLACSTESSGTKTFASVKLTATE